jgi:Protein of unknown function (DUF3011)
MRIRGFLLTALNIVALTAVAAPAAKAQTITCSSDNGRRNYCPADTRGGVRLVQQRSSARCSQGVSWGFDARGIWVDRGCRAVFAINPGRPGAPPGGTGGRPPAQTISCSSNDGKRNYCPIDTRAGVQLIRQRSDARCTQNYSWGYDRRGIWVDRGCRADFAVR